MLGVTNPNSNKVALYAVVTFLVIFSVNVLYELFLLLPDIPTWEELYASVIRSLFTTAVIYLANKGIQWRHTSEGST